MIGVANANAFVLIALVLFPFLAVLTFRLLPISWAAITVLLVGELFLPADGALDLPLLPAFGRDLLVYTTLFVCVLLFARPRLRAARPGTGLELLGVVMAVGGLVTVLLNADTLRYGPVTVQAMPLEETPTAMLADLLQFGVPFLLGRALVRDLRELERVFVALAIAGVVYSAFAIVEMWLSPQFHIWVYGFMATGFDTTYRFGGYRPTVFMRNGLAYAIFMTTALLAATTLARAKAPIPILRLPTTTVAAWLYGILLVSRSVGATVVGGLLAPFLYFVRPRLVMTAALVITLFVAFYPLLRLADLVPWDPVIAAAEELDPLRAKSFAGRIFVEGKLLEKAAERPLFGWGGYSRNWYFDPVTGERDLIPDGHWVLQLGSRGIVGYLADFGAIVIPVLLAFRRFGRIRERRAQILIAGLALILAMRLFDLIPNGRWTSLPLFLAGGLTACLHAATRAVAKPVAPEPVAAAAPPPSEPAPLPVETPLPQPSARRLSELLGPKKRSS